MRNAKSDDGADNVLLRRMLQNREFDLMREADSYTQELTFASFVTFMQGRGLHSHNTRQYFQSCGFFTKEGKYNKVAYLLSDQCPISPRLIVFEGTNKSKMIRKEESSFTLALPNQEIRNLFRQEILNVNPSRFGYNRAATLVRVLDAGDEKGVEDALRQYVLDCFSYDDLKEEKDYQIALTGLLGVLFETYVVHSEVNVGAGRCDILISPKKPHQAGYLFELKHSKAKKEPSASNLKKIADSALRQIQEKHYYVELQQRGAHPIHCYGIAFSKKNNAVFHAILDLDGKE